MQKPPTVYEIKLSGEYFRGLRNFIFDINKTVGDS